MEHDIFTIKLVQSKYSQIIFVSMFRVISTDLDRSGRINKTRYILIHNHISSKILAFNTENLHISSDELDTLQDKKK